MAAGVEWVQLREKDLPLEELASLARRLAVIPRGRTKLLVNGLPAAMVKECGVDGVHLPGAADAQQIAEARALGGLVTVSCHALGELAPAHEASAILWAPVFGKTVHGEPVAPGSGLPLLRAACERVHPVSVFALGGVTAANARACVEAGAAGVAGIRLFQGEGWRVL